MNEEIEKLGNDLIHAVNCFGSGETMRALANKMIYTHPTLNQAFTGGFVLNFVREMANKCKNESYDGRNKYACEACAVMWDALKAKYGYNGSDNISLPLI